MLIETKINERHGHNHNSLHRQINRNWFLTQIDTVNKKLGIATKKKEEIEEEVIEDLSSWFK